MVFRYLKLTAFIFIIMTILPSITGAEGIKGEKSPQYGSNKLLVKFYAEVTDEKKAAIRRDLGAELIKCLKEIRFEVWKLPEGLSVEDAVYRLKKEPSVECSEPEYIYKPQPAPVDTDFDREADPDSRGKGKSDIRSVVKWSQNSILSVLSASLPMFAGRKLVYNCLNISMPLPRITNVQDIFRYASMAARFPAVIISYLVRGFGFVLFALVASFGYLLPFTIFFLMARKQKDEDQIQAGK